MNREDLDLDVIAKGLREAISIHATSKWAYKWQKEIEKIETIKEEEEQNE